MSSPPDTAVLGTRRAVAPAAPAVESGVVPSNGWHPVVVDLAEPLHDIPTRGARILYVTALWHGQPLGHLAVHAPLNPCPAPLLSRILTDAFASALVDARADDLLAAEDRRVTCTGTVVICTRNRLRSLERCLDSLQGLEPETPVDVLVIDNGDGDDAVRRMIEGRGFRWVHETVPGLDRARNRGLLEARSDVVLFTDDDVEVHPGWARELLECFDDPLVGAATGLVLPAVLDTEEQRVFETHFGFGRGMRSRMLDGAHDPPTSAGSLGAGASMAFRRRLMLELGGFPEVLDGGMETKCGGDTYGLYRVLLSGHRAVFEPRALAFHWHREGTAELLKTVTGYSTGIYAYLGHAAWYDQDVAALRAMGAWTVHWVGRRLVDAVLRRRGAPPLPLAWAEVVGAITAPSAIMQAHREVSRRGELLGAHSSRGVCAEPSEAAPPTSSAPAPISVVIPTRGRSGSVRRLVEALDRQDPPAAEIVVVVDGDVDGTVATVGAMRTRTPLRVVLHDRNRGPAIARNIGAQMAVSDVVLFLDDDVLPVDMHLIGEHLRAHRSGDRPTAVVGPCPPTEMRNATPFGLSVRNWWVDHAARLSSGLPLSFTDAGTGNLSVPRTTLLELGGFDDLPRREDWELGYRLQCAGIRVVPALGAVVTHDADLDVANSLSDRMAEGVGDFQFAAAHPEIAHLLPLWDWLSLTSRKHAVVSGLFLAPQVGERLVAAALPVLRALNRAGARRRFHRRYAQAAFGAYWTGIARAAHNEVAFLNALARSTAWSGETTDTVETIELTDRRWAPPTVTTTHLAMMLEGRHVATVPSNWGGFPWSRRRFAERIHDAVRQDLIGGPTSDRHA